MRKYPIVAEDQSRDGVDRDGYMEVGERQDGRNLRERRQHWAG